MAQRRPKLGGASPKAQLQHQHHPHPHPHHHHHFTSNLLSQQGGEELEDSSF